MNQLHATHRTLAPTTVRREILALLHSPRFAGGPLLASLMLAGVSMPLSVSANPQNGTVTAGNAIIVSSTPDRVDVVQSSDRAIINWQGFSIAQGEHTNFQQPSASSVTLNRVTGKEASTLAGTLTANGTVMLVNPNGVVISKSGSVDVGGLVATTADIKDEDFMGQRLRFEQASPNPHAAVRNEGLISIKEHGLAALVAPSVQNSGVIEARVGHVALGGAQTFSLDFQGDGLLSFSPGSAVAIAPEAQQALVSNTGRIAAHGGTVQLSANAVKGVVDQVINTSGVIEARTVGVQAGRIILSGGENGAVQVAGTLDAASTDASGGSVRVTGETIAVTTAARIDASGATGGGTIDIGMERDGTWSALTTRVARGASINADAINQGNGGTINVLSTDATSFAGTMSARGGANGGDGGNVEISSHGQLGLSGTVDLNASHGATGNLLLDPATLTIIDSTAGSGQQDGAAGDHVIGVGDPNTPDNTISRGTLEALSGSTNLTLEALGLITINPMAGGVINLQTDSAHSFTLRSTTSGGIYFVDANTEIRTQGGDIFLQALKTGALMNIGRLTSNGGDIGLIAGGTVQLANTIDAGAGNVSITSLAGSIFNTGSPNAIGAAVTLDASFGSLGTAQNAINTSAAALTLATGGNLYVNNAVALSQLSVSSVHTVATPFVYLINAPQLNFNVTDNGSDYLLDNVVNGGNLLLRFQGDRNIVAGNINAHAGDVTLVSTAGGIRDDGNLATGITGTNLTLQTTAGAIGASGSGAITTAASSLAARTTGVNGVFVNNTGTLALTSLAAGDDSAIASTGNLTVGTVAATGITLGLTSSAGSIFTNGGPNDTIFVGALNLAAGNAIGTVGTPLRTSAFQIDATAVNGIFVGATGNTALGTVVSTNGPITISSAGGMQVDRVNAGTAGVVTLTSTGSSINGSTPGDNVTANGFNFTASNGGVNLGTAASTLTGASGSGGITLRLNGTTTLSSLVSTGQVWVTSSAGDVTINTVRGSNVTVQADAGSLFDDGNANSFITADNAISLYSTPGTVGTTTQHLQTHGPRLTLLSGSDIFVDSDLALTSLIITNNHTTPGVANTLEVTAPYLQFDVTDDGSQFSLTDITGLTLDTLSFTGDQTILVTRMRAPSAALTLRATQGNVLNDGNDDTRITGNSITLAADHGSLGTSPTTGALDVNTATLSATTGGNLYINDITDLSSLTIDSTHENPASDYQYILTAPGLRFDVVDSSAGYAFNTMSDVTSLGFSFTGDRTITAGALDVTRNGSISLLSTQGSVLDDGNKGTRILANYVTLTSFQGTVGSTTGNGYMDVIAGYLAGGADGSFTVALPYPTNDTNTNSAVTLQSINAGGPVRITVDNGNLRVNSLFSNDAVTLDVTNGSILSSSQLFGSSLTLNASGALGSADSTLQTWVNGSITANAAGGGLWLYDAQSISALNATAAGPMVVETDGGMTVGTVTAGANPVTLTAGFDLQDDGNAATRITGSTISLAAYSGSLGTSTAVIGVTTPQLTLQSGGDVYVDDSSALNLLSISGTGSSYFRTNAYSMTAPGLTLAATDDGSSVTLSSLTNAGPLAFTFATQRSLTLGSVNTNGGSATLSSVYESLVDDGDAGTFISAPTVTLNAGQSIGATGTGNAIALDATSLTATAPVDFYVDSTSALSALSLRSTAGQGITNTFGITAAGQTFTLSDNGTTTYLQTVNAPGLSTFSYRGDHNLSLGTLSASGAVALTAAGTIVMDGVGGSRVSGGSVTLDTTNTSNGHIGTSGVHIATGTPSLIINATGNTYVDSNQALSALAITQTHDDINVNYATVVSATGLGFSVTDGATAALNTITGAGLDFIYETDRRLQLGNINVGGAGSVDVTGSGTFQTLGIQDDGNQGTRVTAGSVTLTAGIGYVGSSGNGDIDLTTANLSITSSGDVYASNNTTLSSLALNLGHSNFGNRTYAISSTGLTFNLADQNFLVVGGEGTVLHNVSQSGLNFSLATDRSLQVVTANVGAGGSIQLDSGSISDDANQGTKITAGSLTLLGGSAGSSFGSTLTELDTNVNSLTSSLTSLNLVNDGNLTLHANSASQFANIKLLNGSFISDGSALYTTPNLTLQTDHGSMGTNVAPLLLNARTLTLIGGMDMYVNSSVDLVGLYVTNNHDAVRTNTLNIVAPNLTFDIQDIGGNQFDAVELTDRTGIDFSFTGDKAIQVFTLDVGGGNYLSVRAAGVGHDIFDDGDGTTELTGESITLTADGSVGSAAVVDVNTTNLSITTGNDINVHSNLDLSALNISLAIQPVTPPLFTLTAPNLNFDVTEDGTTTAINDITDTTGLLLDFDTLHAQSVTQIDTQRYGSVSLYSLNGAITGIGSSASRITAANARLETRSNGAIGTLANPIELSAPLVTLWPTGDMHVNSDTHIDSLTIRAQHGAFGTYVINSPLLTFGVTDDVNGTHLTNIVDTDGLNLNYSSDHDFIVGTVNLGTAGSLSVSGFTGAVDILGDGDSNTRISAVSVNLTTNNGALGAAGAGNELNISAHDFSGYANGGGVRLNFVGPVEIGGITANGTSELVNDRDLSIGSFNANGQGLTVTAGGSIVSGNISNAGTVVLNAAGSIGNQQAITTNANGGTTTLTATAGGSVTLNESWTLNASNITANGAVALSSGQGNLTVGTINAGAGNPVTLASGQGSILGNNGANLITGSAVTLIANTTNTTPNIGASGTRVRVDTPSLTLNTRGDIYVTDLADLDTLSIIRPSSSVGAPGGALSLIATNLTFNATDNGSFTTINNITDTTGLTFSLQSYSSILVGTLNVGVNSDVSLVSQRFNADATIGSINGASLLTARNLTLGTSGNNGGAIGTSGTPFRTAVSSLNATAQSGGIFVTQSGTLSLNNVSSGGELNVTTTSGDLVVGTVTYGNNQPLTLRATAARLLDDGVNSTRLLGNGTGAINLVGATGIGTALAPFAVTDQSNNTINASVTGAGSAWLDLATSNGSLNPLVNVTTANGAINVETSGTMTLASLVSTTDADGNDIYANARTGNLVVGTVTAGALHGSIDLLAANGAITAVNGANSISAFDPTLNAATGIGTLATPLNVTGQNVVADTLAGNVYLAPTGVAVLGFVRSQNGAVTVNGTSDVAAANVLASNGVALTTSGANSTIIAGNVNGGSGVVTLTATNGQILDDGVLTTSVVGGAGNFTAANNIGTTGTPLQTQLASLTANVPGTGGVWISQTGNLALGNLTSGGGQIRVIGSSSLSGSGTINANGGRVGLTASNGDVLLTGAIDTVGADPAQAVVNITGNQISIGNVTSTGAQSYTGDTTLLGTLSGRSFLFAGDLDTGGFGTRTIATNLAGNNITVNGDVNGNGAGLALTATGGAIAISGDADDLASFAATANTIGVNDVTTTGAQTYTGTTSFNGSYTTTGGAFTANGAATFGSDATIATGVGGVTFASSLTAQALNVNSAGLTNFAGSVNATSLTTDAPGTLAIAAATITTTGAQSYGEALTLNGHKTFTGMSVTFGGAVNGTTSGQQSLDVVGNAIFGGGAGGAVALQTITVTGTSNLAGIMNSTGAQNYGGAITLGGDTTFIAGNGIDFDSTVDGAHNLAVSTGAADVNFNAAVGGTTRVGDVVVDSTGDTNFNTALIANSLTTNAGGVSNLNAASVDTTGAQTYGDAVVVNTDATLTGSVVTLLNTLNDSSAGTHDLTIDADSVFTQAVGGTAALASLSVSGATQIDGGAVTTTGDQTYGGPVTISDDTTLTGAAIDVVGAFDAAVAGQYALNVAGDVIFSSDVGSNAALATLTVDGNALLNGDVTTVGTQDYNSGVALASNVVLNTDDADVTFNSTLNGGIALSAGVSAGSRVTAAPTLNGAQHLTINAGTGTVTFNDDVGGSSRLGDLLVNTGGPTLFNGEVYAASVTTDTPGTVQLNGGVVNTTGTQSYGEIVTIGANTILTGSTVTLAQALEDSAPGAHTVAINGNAVFEGTVGGTNAFSSLAVSGTSTINGGSVRTTGSQSYGGASLLGVDTTLTSGGSVTFGSTLDAVDEASLTITAQGSINAAGAIGGTGRFDHLTFAANQGGTFGGPITAATGFVVTGLGPVQLAGDVTVTEGPIAISNPLTLVGPSIIMRTDGNITFSSVNGPSTILTLYAGTGTITGGTAAGPDKVVLRDMVVYTAAAAQLYGTLSNIGGGGTAKFVKGPLFGPPYYFNDVPFGPLEFVDRVAVQTARNDAGAGRHLALAADGQSGEYPETGQLDTMRLLYSPDLLKVQGLADSCAAQRDCRVRVISK